MKSINAVIHFNKCSAGSTLASARIAKYISNHTGSVLVDRGGIITTEVNRLYIVNSLYMFCDFRDEVESLVKNAKEIVWVQNDYAIPIPKVVKDEMACKPSWIITNRYTDNSYYLNWNLLTYNPHLSEGKHDIEGLFYFGACRKGRKKYFSKYFNSELYDSYIFTTNKGAKSYKEICNNAIIFKPWTSLRQIQRFQTALYIEDTFIHTNYHSPANRFYEYLSAHLAILFDKSCLNTFDTAGYDVRPYVVDSPDDVNRLLGNYKDVAKEQSKWVIDFKSELDNEFDKVLEGICQKK